jgi:Ca-activated chloride channel homolog
MTFLNPSALMLLLLVPIAGVFFIWRSQVRQLQLNRIGDPRLVTMLVVDMSTRDRQHKSALWLLTLAAIVLALARPAWGVGEEVIEAEGIALLIVLDVSASMDARDVQPSRLERAKLDARQLLDSEHVAEMGLVLFAGETFVQFPLTRDKNAVLPFVNAASSDSISRQGTAIEAALSLAIDSFDQRIAAEFVIILMSDGENHEGEPLRAAEDAALQGITIHTIGYGTLEGASIPEIDMAGTIVGYKADQAGNVVITALDERILQEIAEVTHGSYRRRSESGIEVVDLLNELARMRGAELEKQFQIRQVERFGLFVLLAIVMLTLEMFLPEGKRT